MEVSCQLQAPAALIPGEIAPDTHWIENWVGLRAGLDAVEKTMLPLPETPAVQRVARRNTDWAIQLL
jgi:hypothetical protein